MRIERISDRNLTVIFEEPFRTTTHLILAENRVYVCDTFLGPNSMGKITKILEDEGASAKRIVVFNTHADWDHIWGNCYFEKSVVIGHYLSKKRILEDGESELKQWGMHAQGEIVLKPPRLMFDEGLTFKDDEVEFFHTPGHTVDSSSCYDHREGVLIVGDNIESEVPYVNTLDFDSYLHSLRIYLEREWSALVPGHDPVQYDSRLLKRNIKYLEAFRDWSVVISKLSKRALQTHITSLATLVNPLLETGITKEIREHYQSAVERLEQLGIAETTFPQLEKLRVIASGS